MVKDCIMSSEDLLPEGLPEGWKVEIRVRKSGKKDRYYTDPVYGYIFRSIKDIDRYLLTGKLGRHVTRIKPNESSSDTLKPGNDDHTVSMRTHGKSRGSYCFSEIDPRLLRQDVSEKKELIKSDETKEPCLGLVAEGQNEGDSAPKRKASPTTQDSKETNKKRPSRRPSSGNSSRSSRKKENASFFILDSDQCEESDATDIPNLAEIIDSIHKEKEGHKTVYISAPAIGSLLGGQQTRATPKQAHHDMMPRFFLNVPQHINHTPNMAYIPSMMPKQEYDSKNIVRPYQYASPFSKVGTEIRPIGVPGRALFGNLLTDPCIDFAFKTLTGTAPFAGGDTGVEDCFSPQQIGPSRVFSSGNLI